MAAIGVAGWAAMASMAASAAAAQTQAEQMKQQRKAEEMAADAQAKRAAIAANEAEASGQRQAIEARKKADAMASRALAVAAASGAGTEGIQNLMSGFAEAGEEEAGYRKYQTMEQGKGLMDAASIGKVYQENRANAMKVEQNASMLGTVAQGVSLYSKYGGSGAPNSTGIKASSIPSSNDTMTVQVQD